jgi:hypothetical protein
MVQYRTGKGVPSMHSRAQGDRQPAKQLLLRGLNVPDTRTERLSQYLHSDFFKDHTDTWIGFDALQLPYGLSIRCLTALAESYYERKTSGLAPGRTGTKLYLSSIQNVNRSLSDARARGQTDTLLAVAILGLFEVCSMNHSTTFPN